MPKLSPKKNQEKRRIAKIKKDNYFILFENVALNLAYPMKKKEEGQELIQNSYWIPLINGLNLFMIDQGNNSKLNHHPSDLALMFTLAFTLALFSFNVNTSLQLPYNIKKKEFINHVLPVQSYLAEYLSGDHLYLLDEILDLVLNVHNINNNGEIREMDNNSFNYSHDFSCEFLDVFEQLYPGMMNN